MKRDSFHFFFQEGLHFSLFPNRIPALASVDSLTFLETMEGDSEASLTKSLLSWLFSPGASTQMRAERFALGSGSLILSRPLSLHC